MRGYGSGVPQRLRRLKKRRDPGAIPPVQRREIRLAGGGMKSGQVIGASDARGEARLDGKGMSPDDVAASFYHCLGIDARKEYRTPTGRPVAFVVTEA